MSIQSRRESNPLSYRDRVSDAPTSSETLDSKPEFSINVRWRKGLFGLARSMESAL